MKACSSNKRIYSSSQLAEDALIEANVRHYNDRSRPVAIYMCDECGQYHLTSKGPVNPRLAALIKEGKIDKQREANHWIDKLGH